jgi:hypothetical protein
LGADVPPVGALHARPAKARAHTFTEDADSLERAYRYLRYARASKQRTVGNRADVGTVLTYRDAEEALCDRALAPV